MIHNRQKNLTAVWRGLRLLSLVALIFLVSATPLWPQSEALVARAAGPNNIYLPVVFRNYNGDCRFGITVPYGLDGFDVANLGAGSYLNWGMSASPARPNGIAYIQEARLGGANYATMLTQIPAVAAAQPGSYWLVGNEPDTTYGLVSGGEQDNLWPITYTLRYHDAYNQIKAADPTAKVGIGGIVQPTAVRREYLNRVFAAYQSTYGSLPPSDFWHIHAFVLSEGTTSDPPQYRWGTGMPSDHATRPYTAPRELLNPDQNDSRIIFDQRLTAFRQWMAQNGQRNKPLWITEYGVLMPSTYTSDPASPYYNLFTISINRTQAFMQWSFSYFQTRADLATGLATDKNLLVQRWYWWALSTNLRQTGGGLYDESLPGKPKTVLYNAYASASNCR